MKNSLLSLATIIITLLFPSLINAQAPTLGTSASYVVLSSDGAVGNTSLSQYTGNVGTNNGAITGFGNVNGVMHNADTSSGRASSDLQIAYDQLNNASPNYFPAPLIGNGDTLVAGVYKIAGVTTLSGTLYLDAKGNPNAVFIFQVQAAFSSNPDAKVVLLNNALACNVFWKIEGAVNLGTSTAMKGTILAHNAAIDMTKNDTLEGRALSIAGAVTMNGVLAYLPTGCGSPVLTGPAAPSMVASSCFAIFSGNGDVTNSGITHVTGDIGTNVGLTTGYDALYVTGNIHPIPDSYTSACNADLLNVYNYLNTLPTDIELLYPAQFGKNLVLTPHTYLMNAATTFTDSIYLNACDNYNAVFVIKVKGALSTSTYSKVLLINGTQAKNVYWVVDGAVTINDYSVFNGTIICNNGALNLNTGTTINGRAMTTGGAVSTTAIIATSPSGACNTLPVSWLYFTGKQAFSSVLLEWGTTSELNNGSFTIEKSSDGVNFETLTTIPAYSGPGNGSGRYSFNDMQPFEVSYYRISQTDRDNHRNYYRTIQVKSTLTGGLHVQQYVSGNSINVQVSGANPGKGTITLYGIDGKKLSSKSVSFTRGENTYQLAKPSLSGIYLLNIVNEGQVLYNGKVILP